MKILVFGKKRQTKDGKAFTAYVSKLKKRDGSEVAVGVKFREECGAPKLEETPCYIEVEREDANLSTKNFEVEDAETHEIKDVEQRTLWVSHWLKSEEEYVDHSLDEFED